MTMTEKECAVAEAVLHCHDAMEGIGAKEVPTAHIMERLTQKHGFADPEDRPFVADVLSTYHGDLWIVAAHGDGSLPPSVFLIEEMAGTIEWDVLGDD